MAEKTTAPQEKPAKKKAKKSAKATGNQAKFPRHPVAQALRIPKAILEQNAGKACSVKAAAEFLGLKAHGPFRVEVSSGKEVRLPRD